MRNVRGLFFLLLLEKFCHLKQLLFVFFCQLLAFLIHGISEIVKGKLFGLRRRVRLQKRVDRYAKKCRETQQRGIIGLALSGFIVAVCLAGDPQVVSDGLLRDALRLPQSFEICHGSHLTCIIATICCIRKRSNKMFRICCFFY